MKKNFKKVLSIFLTAVMLMTAWVFVAPEKAAAATAGSYYVRITGGYKCSSSWRCSKLNETFSAEWDKTTNDSAGVVIRYKTNNGEGDTVDLTVDMHDWGSQTNTDWATKITNVTVPGFPIGFYFVLDQNDFGAGGGTTYFHINKIEIGSSSSNLKEIWTGTLKHESTNGTKKTYIYQDGTNNASGGSVYESSGGWTLPYANSISLGSTTDQSVTVPSSGTSSSTTATSATVKDQYGVNWYQDASWAFNTSNSAVNSSATATGVSAGTGCLRVTNSAKTYCSGSASKTLYINAYIGTVKSSTIKVTVNNIKYTATYSWKKSGLNISDENETSTQSQYYGMKLTAPSDPGMYWDASNHYEFSSWSPSIGNSTGTNTYTATYTSTVHDNYLVWKNSSTQHWQECSVCHWTTVKSSHNFGEWSADTATCTTGGTQSRTCKDCGYEESKSTSELGHDYSSVTVKSEALKSAATCTEAAVYYYSCSRCGTVEKNDNHTFIDGEALGHDWDYANATFNWDGYTCSTATVKCKRNENHTIDVNTSVTNEITKAVTCTEAGEKTYMAKFIVDGTEYTATKAEKIEKIAHTAGAAVEENRVEATCETAGSYDEVVYCSVCEAELSRESKTIPALGHKWGNWTYDNETNHKRICGNDKSHTETKAHSWDEGIITTPATCTAEGVKTFTCSVCGGTKTEAVEKIAHTDGTPTIENRIEPSYDSDGSFDTVIYCTVCETELSRDTTVISKLESLAPMPDMTVKAASDAGASASVSISTAEGITTTALGLSKTGNHDILNAEPSSSTALTLDKGFAKITDGVVSYVPSTMTFNTVDSVYVVVKIEGVAAENYSQNTVYSYIKLTFAPDSIMVFNDGFGAIEYSNGGGAEGYGVWTVIDDSGTEIDQLAEATKSYDNSLYYSLGNAHKVTVSDGTKKPWPSASFTFTGTGFDLISVTDSDSGVFVITVTQNGNKIMSKMVDTYYGYTHYSKLYYNDATKKIVSDDTGLPLYKAKEDAPEEEIIRPGFSEVTYTTNIEYAEPKTQAGGWLLDKNASNSMYQVPVLSAMMEEYGTYDVKIEARFTKMFGHYNETGDTKWYNLTVDGIRIYEPGGSEGLKYQLVRELVENGNASVLKAEVDGYENLGTNELKAQLAGCPNNELYIEAGGTVTFTVKQDISSLKVGAKAIDGNATKISINAKDAINVNTANEQYFNIDAKKGDTVTITNSGDALLSLTKLVYSLEPAKSSAPAEPNDDAENSLDAFISTPNTVLAARKMLMAAAPAAIEDENTEPETNPENGEINSGENQNAETNPTDSENHGESDKTKSKLSFFDIIRKLVDMLFELVKIFK